MTLVQRTVKIAFPILIVAAVSFFFYRTFQSNWSNLQQFKFNIHYGLVVSSFALTLVHYLLFTYCWTLALNHLATDNKITYLMSVGTVNTSSLTKYLPGKVWSYALQMYWLEKLGFRKSLVLYVNMVNLIISLLTASMVGLLCLTLFAGPHLHTMALGGLVLVVVVDIAYILFNRQVFEVIIYLMNRLFGRNIQYYYLSTSQTIYLHVLHVVAGFSFGASAYLLSVGIGFDVSLQEALSIVGAMIISDVVGFLAVIVPGGVGVRESIMYYVLKSPSTLNLALVLPLAARVVHMLVDVTLGGIGYVLLKSMVAAKSGGQPTDQQA